MNRPHAIRRRGFSLVEMIVVLAVLATLAVLTWAGLSQARESAKLTQCTLNLRTIGVAFNVYASDHDGIYPPFPTKPDVSQGAYFICDVLGGGEPRWKYFGVLYGEGYLTDPRVFYCPAARPGYFDYASQWEAKSKASGGFSSLFRIGYYQRIVDDTFPVPGKLRASEGKLRVIMTDANSSENSLHRETANSTDNYPRRGINVLFNDGHVKYDSTGLRWNQPNQWAYSSWEADP